MKHKFINKRSLDVTVKGGKYSLWGLTSITTQPNEALDASETGVDIDDYIEQLIEMLF